jgi:hypothetical protein
VRPLVPIAMTDKKTFEIYFLKKIPYLTNGLLILFLLSAVILIFIYAGINNRKATPEIMTFYLIHTSIVKVLFVSAFSTGTFFILYLWAKLKKKGLIVFNADSFELLFKKEQMNFPISSIRTVWCNDSEDKNGEPNKKFTMTIDTWKDKKILVRLRNTEDISQFTSKLLSYDQLKIEYHYSRWAELD